MIDNALTLITLASLFILGPAIGYAVVSCFNWQNWAVSIQHLAVGILYHGGGVGDDPVLWVAMAAEPDVGCLGWIQELQPAGKLRPTAPVEVRQPLKK